MKGAEKPVLFDYWRSSASYRVRIALNLAGIDYETMSVDLLKADQKAPDHMARNPQGLVPVLDIDGHRFTQSLAIIAYLDQTRDMGLLPDDPAARAHALALTQVISVDLHPVCNSGVVAHVTTLAPGDTTAKDWMHRFIPPALVAFERLLGQYRQTPYCTGPTLSLADICLVPQIYNARRWGVSLSDLSAINAVVTACEAHPAFAAAHPDRVKPA